MYMKDATANAEFLKIKDATTEFVEDRRCPGGVRIKKARPRPTPTSSVGSTAQDFVQGTGGVAPAPLTFAPGSSCPQTLLQGPGTNGAIIVVCTPHAVAAASTFRSSTTRTPSALPAVQDLNGQMNSPDPIPRGGSTLMTISGPKQIRLQTFPASGFDQVLTLTLSAEPAADGGFMVVGQMLNGAG